MTTTKDTTPEPEPQEAAQEAAQEAVPADALPEGAEVVTKAPEGQWEQLIDGDGKPVKVGRKFVQVTR